MSLWHSHAYVVYCLPKPLLPRCSKLLAIFPGRRSHFSLKSAPAGTLRLQFTNYQQSYVPWKKFLNSFCFQLTPLTVYIRSTELYRSQFMCYILLLAKGIECPTCGALIYRIISPPYICIFFLPDTSLFSFQDSNLSKCQ